MANELGEPWLELIEGPSAAILDSFAHSGWLSLGIRVKDMAAWRNTLDEDAFRVIGEPVNLEVSKVIRAMQVIGSAGEMLYLTEVLRYIPKNYSRFNHYKPLAGSNLIEIDELDGLQTRTFSKESFLAGICAITFAVKEMLKALTCQVISEGPFAGHKYSWLIGAAGERI